MSDIMEKFIAKDHSSDFSRNWLIFFDLQGDFFPEVKKDPQQVRLTYIFVWIKMYYCFHWCFNHYLIRELLFIWRYVSWQQVWFKRMYEKIITCMSKSNVLIMIFIAFGTGKRCYQWRRNNVSQNSCQGKKTFWQDSEPADRQFHPWRCGLEIVRYIWLPCGPNTTHGRGTRIDCRHECLWGI